MKKVYVFSSLLYDENGHEYRGDHKTKAFIKLDKAYEYAKEFHDKTINGFKSQGIEFTEKIESFSRGSLKYLFITKDEFYEGVDSIMEMDLVE